MVRIALLLAVIACDGQREPACDLKPAQALLADGRLERTAAAVRALGPRCAASREATALLADVDAQLRAPGEPYALLRDGLAARARGDEPGAHRAFDRARMLAEQTARATARIVPGETHVISAALYSMSTEQGPWSPDGRFVVFARGSGDTALHSPLGLVVVDTKLRNAFRIDAPATPLFSPNSQFLAYRHEGKISVVSLASRQRVLADRDTVINPVFAPDGRLVWAERKGDEDVLYLRDLATGVETGLRARARPDKNNYTSAIEQVMFGSAGVLVTWSIDEGVATWGDHATIRVWDTTAAKLLATVEGLAEPEPLLRDDLLVYAVPGPTEESARLRAMRYRSSDPLPQPRSKQRGCGDGEIGEYSPLQWCGSDVVVAATGRTHICQWSTSTGKLVYSARLGENEDPSCFKGKAAGAYAGPPDGEDEIPETERTNDDGSVSVKLGDAFVRLVDSKFAEDFAPAPRASAVAGIVYSESSAGSRVGGRARVWNAAGELLWSAPQPPTAVTMRFAPDGELVAADRSGRVWHFPISPVTMRVTPPTTANCMLDAFAVIPDGRAAMFCRGEDGAESLVLEGTPQPVAIVPPYNWHAMIVGSSTSASALITTNDSTRVWSLPDGKVRWSTSTFLTGPSRHALTAAGDKLVSLDYGTLVLRGPGDKTVWQQPGDTLAHPTRFNRDGSMFATMSSEFGGIGVRDAGTGGKLAELPWTRGPGVAFSSTGLVAYWRSEWEDSSTKSTRPQGLVIYDVRAKREVGSRTYVGSMDRYLDTIDWSSDDKWLAALTRDAITVWGRNELPAWTIVPAGDAAAVIAGDGSVTLLGDRAAARELLACRVGADLYPVELCEGRAL